MAWNVDYAHSSIQFSARHMMISTVRGHFERWTAQVDLDEANPEKSLIDVQIEAASLTSNNADRDAHLRSADFIEAEKHPYITFKSKRVERTGEDTARLIGDLTIRGVTREVALDVEYLGQAPSPWGTVAAGFSARTKISRKAWGLTWNVALETGGVLVGDEITINIELELVKQPETAPANANANAA